MKAIQKKLKRSLKQNNKGDGPTEKWALANNMAETFIYTDGSYSRERNLGGYAYVVTLKCGRDRILKRWCWYDVVTCDKGYDSNVMELIAITKALESLGDKNIRSYGNIRVYTDSMSIVNLVNSNKKHHFKNEKALREWKKLYRYIDAYHIKVRFISGKDGNKDHRKCDSLAKLAISLKGSG